MPGEGGGGGWKASARPAQEHLPRSRTAGIEMGQQQPSPRPTEPATPRAPASRVEWAGQGSERASRGLSPPGTEATVLAH